MTNDFRGFKDYVQSPFIPTATCTTSKVSGPFSVAILTVFEVLNVVDSWLGVLVHVQFILRPPRYYE